MLTFIYTLAVRLATVAACFAVTDFLINKRILDNTFYSQVLASVIIVWFIYWLENELAQSVSPRRFRK